MLCAGLAFVPPVRADVYKYVDANGIVHYTDQKPVGGQRYRILVHESAGHRVDWSTVPLNLTAYAAEIHRASRQFGVDSALVRAVIHAESWFQAQALSKKGAQGLMQLMPATQIQLGVTDAFNVQQNITAGVQYLSELLQSFHGDTSLATAAYNAGPGAVREYGGIPPYPETKNYVQRVQMLHQRYQQAL